eukprot:6302072-Alexandrium_andersonii.AAC.1
MYQAPPAATVLRHPPGDRRPELQKRRVEPRLTLVEEQVLRSMLVRGGPEAVFVASSDHRPAPHRGANCAGARAPALLPGRR